MKRNILFAVTIVLSLFLYLSFNDVNAQRGMKWKGSGGWGMGSKYGRMYDVKTVEAIIGTVSNVERIAPMKGMSYGVHITMRTEQETLSVHLGPAWFIENQDFTIEENDELENKGSRIDFEGISTIIAAEIEKGDQTLRLREESGVPVWSGWRRR